MRISIAIVAIIEAMIRSPSGYLCTGKGAGVLAQVGTAWASVSYGPLKYVHRRVCSDQTTTRLPFIQTGLCKYLSQHVGHLRFQQTMADICPVASKIGAICIR